MVNKTNDTGKSPLDMLWDMLTPNQQKEYGSKEAIKDIVGVDTISDPLLKLADWKILTESRIRSVKEQLSSQPGMGSAIGASAPAASKVPAIEPIDSSDPEKPAGRIGTLAEYADRAWFDEYVANPENKNVVIINKHPFVVIGRKELGQAEMLTRLPDTNEIVFVTVGNTAGLNPKDLEGLGAFVKLIHWTVNASSKEIEFYNGRKIFQKKYNGVPCLTFTGKTGGRMSLPIARLTDHPVRGNKKYLPPKFEIEGNDLIVTTRTGKRKFLLPLINTNPAIPTGGPEAKQPIDSSKFDPSLAPLIARLNDPDDKEVLYINGRAVLYLENLKEAFFEDKGKIKKINVDNLSNKPEKKQIYDDFKTALSKPERRIDGYVFQPLNKKQLAQDIRKFNWPMYDAIYIGFQNRLDTRPVSWLERIEKDQKGNDVYIYAKNAEQNNPASAATVTPDPVVDEPSPILADPIQFFIGDTTKNQKGTIYYCNETPDLMAVIYNNSDGQKRFIVLSRERDGELFDEIESQSDKKESKRILKDQTLITQMLEQRSIDANELDDGVTITNKQTGKTITFESDEYGGLTATVTRPDLDEPLTFSFGFEPVTEVDDGAINEPDTSSGLLFSKDWFDALPMDDPQVRLINGKKYFYLEMQDQNGFFLITLNKGGEPVFLGINEDALNRAGIINPQHNKIIINLLNAVRDNDQIVMDDMLVKYNSGNGDTGWVPFKEGRYTIDLKKMGSSQPMADGMIVSFKDGKVTAIGYKDHSLGAKYIAQIPDRYLPQVTGGDTTTQNLNQTDTPITKAAFEHYFATSQNGDVLNIFDHPFIVLESKNEKRLGLLTLAPNNEVIHIDLTLENDDRYGSKDEIKIVMDQIRSALRMKWKSLWDQHKIKWETEPKHGFHILSIPGLKFGAGIIPLDSNSAYKTKTTLKFPATILSENNTLVLGNKIKHTRFVYHVPAGLLGNTVKKDTQQSQVFSKEWFDAYVKDPTHTNIRYSGTHPLILLDCKTPDIVGFLTLDPLTGNTIGGYWTFDLSEYRDPRDLINVAQMKKALLSDNPKLSNQSPVVIGSQLQFPGLNLLAGSFPVDFKEPQTKEIIMNTKVQALGVKGMMQTEVRENQIHVTFNYSAKGKKTRIRQFVLSLPEENLPKTSVPVIAQPAEQAPQNTPITREAFEHYFATSQNKDILNIANHPFIVLPNGTANRMALLTLAHNGEVVLVAITAELSFQRTAPGQDIAISMALGFIQSIKKNISEGLPFLDHDKLIWAHDDVYGTYFTFKNQKINIPVFPLTKDSPLASGNQQKTKIAPMNTAGDAFEITSSTTGKIFSYPIPTELLGVTAAPIDKNDNSLFSKDWFDALPANDPQVRFINRKKYLYLEMNNRDGLFFITLNKSGAPVILGQSITDNSALLNAVRTNDQTAMDQLADFGEWDGHSRWNLLVEGRFKQHKKKATFPYLKPANPHEPLTNGLILSFKEKVLSLIFLREDSKNTYTARMPDAYLNGINQASQSPKAEPAPQTTIITKAAFENYFATSKNGDVISLSKQPCVVLDSKNQTRLGVLTTAPNGEIVLIDFTLEGAKAMGAEDHIKEVMSQIRMALKMQWASLWDDTHVDWASETQLGFHVLNFKNMEVRTPILPIFPNSIYKTKINKRYPVTLDTRKHTMIIKRKIHGNPFVYQVPPELFDTVTQAGLSVETHQVFEELSDDDSQDLFYTPILKPEDLPLLEHDQNPYQPIDDAIKAFNQIRPSLGVMTGTRTPNKAEIVVKSPLPVIISFVGVKNFADFRNTLSKNPNAKASIKWGGDKARYIPYKVTGTKDHLELTSEDGSKIILEPTGTDGWKVRVEPQTPIHQWLDLALYGPTMTLKNIVEGENAKLEIEVKGYGSDEVISKFGGAPGVNTISYPISRIEAMAALIGQYAEIYRVSVAEKRNPIWQPVGAALPVSPPTQEIAEAVGAGSPTPEIDSIPETNPTDAAIHESPQQNDAIITGGEIADGDITDVETQPLQLQPEPVPEPIIKNESIKTHVLRGEKEILSDPFELILTTSEDPLTHEKTITGATLELKMDQILQNALHFNAKDLMLKLENIAVSFTDKVILAFNHPTLGEIAYQIYTDATGASRAIRFPLEKIWEVERQDGKYLLQGMGGENHAVEFLMTRPAQRRSPHGFYRENLFVIDPTVLPAFLTWCQILGDPVEFKEGEHTGVALVTPAERKKDGVTLFQAEGGRFVAFKQNADGSLPLISLWLTDDEKQAVERAREKSEPLQAASSTLLVDVDEAPQVFSPLPKMGVEPGDVFLPTNETIQWIQEQFLNIPPHTKSPFALGQSLKQNLEFETASGLVISIPVIWTGRPRNPFKLDGKGSFVTNAKGEIHFDDKGQPRIKGNRIATYINGHKGSTLKYVDYSFWSYDQGGFWNMYVMTPVDQTHVKPFNLRLAFSKQSPLFFALFNTLNEKHNVDDEALYQKSAVSELQDLLQRHVCGNHFHSSALYLRRKKVEIENGKPIALRFVSPDDFTEYKAELTGFRLKGLKLNDQADRLDVDPYLTLTITRHGKDPKIVTLEHSRTTEPHVILLTEKLNPGEVFDPTKHCSFYWHLKTGILIEKSNGKSVAFDEKAFLKWLEVNHLLSKDWQVDFGANSDPSSPRGSFRFKEGSSVGFDFPLTDIPEMPIAHQGFALPKADLVEAVKDQAQVDKILEGISLHDQVFVPVEESLFAQTLIGRDTEVMRFISRDGLILQIPMNSTQEGKNYVADLDPNSVFRIAGTRLLVPNRSPDGKGKYYDLKTTVLHERRLSGGDRIMELEVAGTIKHHFDLHQFTTSQTFSGKTAFGYHSKQRGREWKVTPANAARVLRSWIEYLKLDAQSIPDRLSMDLKLAEADGEGVIQNKLVLSNQDQLDLQIAKKDNRHFMVTGLKKGVGSEGESEVRLDYIEHDSGKNKSFKVYRSSDESALFYLYDPEVKKYFNFVISSEGQLWVWERKALISKFLNPDSSVGFDMSKIVPTTVKENYANDAKSRATRVTVSKEDDPIKHFEVTAILGRWEGASDLDFTADKGGKLARLRFHVLVDEEGNIELDLGNPNDMEVESGAYFPWDNKSKLQMTEDEWIDNNGVKHRGTVRINVFNPDGKSEVGKDIEPYATVEFKNREALIGEDFEVSKAHYNKDGTSKKKIMPGERGYLCHRGGLVAPIGYFGVQDFLKLGEAGKAMLQSLVPTQAMQSDYPLIMSALELLGGYVKPDHSVDEADVIEMAHFGNELTAEDLISTDDEFNPQTEVSETAQPPGVGPLLPGSLVGIAGSPSNVLPNGVFK